MDGIQIRALIFGYVNATDQAKQRLGRCFAVELGLEAGSLGRDGGVDGSGYTDDGRKIYFQSKLSGKPLGAEQARDFYKKILEQQADIGIILAGIGFTKTFAKYKLEYPEIENTKIYLLSLQDIIEENYTYLGLLADLPKSANLRNTLS